MEVGRLVIVEIHRDHDAVEEADAGHGAIMRRGADGCAADGRTRRRTGPANEPYASTYRPLDTRTNRREEPEV
jgi:hypothetical protein